MTPTAYQQALTAKADLIDLFPGPKGIEYSLAWGYTSDTGQGNWGSIRATDFVFNYYFFPAAFASSINGREIDVKGSTYVMHRRIGGPGINVSKAAFKYVQRPSRRTGTADSGLDLYVKDGEKLWNFEITGDINHFDAWLAKISNLGMKRPFLYRTATGVKYFGGANVSTPLNP
jgi:hypothetical protein